MRNPSPFRVDECPPTWVRTKIRDLLEDTNHRASKASEIPLCSLTIESGVVPKSERYEREFLLKEKGTDPYKIAQWDDIVFNPMNMRFGAVARVTISTPVRLSAYYNVLRVKDKSIILPYYLETILKWSRSVKFYDSIASGSLIEKRRVHWSALSEVELPLPPLSEQKKISEILSCWDRGIEEIKDYKLLLRSFKAACLNFFFSQIGGESQVEFSAVATLRRDRVDPKDIQDEKWPRSVELEHFEPNDGFLLGFNEGRSFGSTKCCFDKGDVLFGKLRPYLRKYWLAEWSGACSSEVWVLQAQGISSSLLFYLVQSNAFIHAANKTTGTKMPRANYDAISSEQFWLPPKSAQEEVIGALISLDQMIKSAEFLQKSLTIQKCGLMQQLLTGKVRVKGAA